MWSLFENRTDVSLILFADEVTEFTEMTLFRLTRSGTVTAEMVFRALEAVLTVVTGHTTDSNPLENDMCRYFFCNGGTIPAYFTANGFKGVLLVQKRFNLFTFIKC